MLTIAGNITKTNRAGFEAGKDVFFNYHQRKFTQAFEFDQTMLEDLGMKKAVVNYSGAPVRVEGPLLDDVLAAAGAQPGKIRITALDGFTTELNFDELTASKWIVALKADGRYLSLGQRGPIWVVFSRRDGRTATTEDEERWPWAAFLVEIE